MKRTFELIDGKSAKFWEIDLDGLTHTVRYGRLGAKGQSKSKSFDDEDAARKSADKLIAAKTKKGYVEVEAAPAEATSLDPEALAEQLTRLDADPSPEGRAVFGDWLQSQGHPWGTLISLDRAGQADERDALLGANPAILGSLGKATRTVRIGWQQGFIDEIMIASGGKSAVLRDGLRALFALPAARYLRRLVLDGDPATLDTNRDWDDSRSNIVQPFNAVIKDLANAPKTLRELALGDPPPKSASAYVANPDLAALAKVLPDLEVLEVQCAGEAGFGAFAFASLRRLEIRLAQAGDDDLRAIEAAKLPALEHLSVWFGGQAHCTLDDVYSPDYDDWGDDDDDEDRMLYPESYPSSDLDLMEVYSSSASVSDNSLQRFCSASWPATLKHLGLQSGIFDVAALRAIAGSGVIAQLDSLDLSGGTLDDKGAAELARHAKQLGHLGRLDLRRNLMSKKGVAAVMKALPNADCGEQRSRGAGPEFLFRYVATME